MTPLAPKSFIPFRLYIFRIMGRPYNQIEKGGKPKWRANSNLCRINAHKFVVNNFTNLQNLQILGVSCLSSPPLAAPMTFYGKKVLYLKVQWDENIIRSPFTGIFALLDFCARKYKPLTIAFLTPYFRKTPPTLSLVEVIYLLIKFNKNTFFPWNTNNTDRNGIHQQNIHKTLRKR